MGVTTSASTVGAREPQTGNLLQASRRAAAASSQRQLPSTKLFGEDFDQSAQRSVEFFTKDFERMDELREYNQTKRQCHPKCTWHCGTSSCNNRCQPRCQAPKCVTACKKPTMAKCNRVCKDPQCAVVCPPQCEQGTCPKCKTVCGEAVCNMECGPDRCESHCADPDCVWDCAPDPVCAKPTCKLSCDTTVCTFGKDQRLPDHHETPYLGEEIAWKGLGKIPAEHFAEFAPKTFTKVQAPEGAQMFDGAKPLPAAGVKSLAGETGVKATGESSGQVRWLKQLPAKDIILAPNTLSAR